MIYRTVIIII